MAKASRMAKSKKGHDELHMFYWLEETGDLATTLWVTLTGA